MSRNLGIVFFQGFFYDFLFQFQILKSGILWFGSRCKNSCRSARIFEFKICCRSAGILVKLSWLPVTKKKRPLVSAVIVNYNTKELLQECLDYLEQNYSPLEIIIVDNNSTDGSKEYLKKLKKLEISSPSAHETSSSDFRRSHEIKKLAARNISLRDEINNFSPDGSGRISSFVPAPGGVNFKIIFNDQNLGLAVGNNLGWRQSRGKYVLFIGSDALVQPGAIPALVEFMEAHPQVGISVGQVRLRNGQLDWDTHRGLPTPWVALTHFLGLDRLFPRSRLFGRYYLADRPLDSPHEIELCSSHFMFTRRKMLEELGGWDEDFFVYGEDVDLCWRARQQGWKIFYLPQARVIHYKGASVGIRRESQDVTKANLETKRRMILETTQAMLIFYRKHYPRSYLAWLVTLAIKILRQWRLLKLKLFGVK